MKIDELAQRSGTTTRNIRAYQARGLIPAPHMRGRTGYYHDEHLRRLEIIRDLQERGFSLEAIRHTLDTWAAGGDLGQMLGLHSLVTAPWTDEQPGRLTADELLERFPQVADQPELVAQAVDLGLLTPLDDGTFEVPSPMVIDAGTELARAGIPLDQIFELVKAIRADVADLAQRFVEVVGRNLVDPLAEGTGGPAPAAEVTEAIRRLRPIALEVVRPFLAQEMERATNASLGELAARLDAEPPDA